MKNQITEFTQVVKTVEEVCLNWNVDTKYTSQINLAIEEAVSNILFYAYTDSGEHQITILINYKPNQIGIKITDDGKQFNILEVNDEVDVTAPAEDRKIGGLGIFLMKQMVDDIEYERKGNFNILKLTKNLQKQHYS